MSSESYKWRRSASEPRQTQAHGSSAGVTKRGMRVVVKFLVFLGCLALVSCASTSPASKELAATLIFVRGDKPMDKTSGIYSVGDYSLPRVSLEVNVAPGLRNIGYSCPGYVFVDSPPSASHKFEGGLTYEMSCQNGSSIFQVRKR